MNATTLATPGLVWGQYPERPLERAQSKLADWLRAGAALVPARTGGLPRAAAVALITTRARLAPLNGAGWVAAVNDLRRALKRDGLTPSRAGAALACAGVAMQRATGLTPYPTQYYAAWLILQGRFAEMSTGEGKTLVAGLAAAVGALADTPVHLITANDYLVQRDRETLRAFYTLLGITTGAVVAGMPADGRRRAYRKDVTYVTAKEVVFDYLKDHLALDGRRDPLAMRVRSITGEEGGGRAEPLLKGLCMAVLDEADSILLDEAGVPLVLSAPVAPIDEKLFRLAFDVAGALWRNRDYTIDRVARSARLTDAGRAAVATAIAAQVPAGVLRRRAEELVEQALAARHLFRRDHEYVVADDGIAIIDPVTGRIADGRQWSNGLHQMVEIKEGVPPSPLTATVAQITFQRFFPRYVRLGGMSGTISEAARELRVFFGTPTAAVPLAKPSRRRWLGTRIFATGEERDAAVVDRARELIAAGRPVLIGVASVAASDALGARLTTAGIEHQVLNAAQSAEEAARIAKAGEAAMVTVSTNIAGRGTDIRLPASVEASGGLHVILAMTNRARRIDRQLIGRAARHGDRGSAEAMLACDDALVTEFLPDSLRRLLPRLPAPLARDAFALAQRIAELTDYERRRQLRRADQRAAEIYAFSGGVE